MKADVKSWIQDGRLQVQVDLKGDLPGHPFRGNQWGEGEQEDPTIRLAGSLAPTLSDDEIKNRSVLHGLHVAVAGGIDRDSFNKLDMPPTDQLRSVQLQMNGGLRPIQLTEPAYKIADQLGLGKGREAKAALQSMTSQAVYDLLDQQGFIVHEGEGKGKGDWAVRLEDAIPNMSNSQKDSIIDILPKMSEAYSGRTSESFFISYGKKDFSDDQLSNLSDGFEKVAGEKPLSTVVNPDSGKMELDFFNAVDRNRASLWPYTKNYDVFKVGMAAGWSGRGGGEPQQLMRGLASNLDQNKLKNLWTDSGEKLRLNVDRAVTNCHKLKRETEQFYKAKFGKKTDPDPDLSKKEIEIYRGVDKIGDSYVAGAVESWTKQKSTTSSFSGRGGGILTAKATYNDVLFSYESFADNPGWPAEQMLRGKKEFAVLGGALKDMSIDRK